MAERLQRSAAGRIKTLVGIVCTGSIVAMIAFAVSHRLGGVIAFGCIATAAIVVLLATVVVEEDTTSATTTGRFDEAQAQRVEQLATALIDGGGSEDGVRSLVRESVRLGRSDQGTAP